MGKKGFLKLIIDAHFKEIENLTEYDLAKIKNNSKMRNQLDSIENYISTLRLSLNAKNTLSDMIYDFDTITKEELLEANLNYYEAGVIDTVNFFLDAKKLKNQDNNTSLLS